MNKKKQEKEQQQENLNKFNSVTQKTTPENQNQTFNVKQEGISRVNHQR